MAKANDSTSLELLMQCKSLLTEIDELDILLRMEEEDKHLCCLESFWQDHSASPVYDESNQLSELKMEEKVIEKMLLDQWERNDKLMLSQGLIHQRNMQLRAQITECRLSNMSSEEELKHLQAEYSKMKRYGEINIASAKEDLRLTEKLLQIIDCEEDRRSTITSTLFKNPTIMQVIGLFCQVVLQILPAILGCLAAIFCFFCLSFHTTLVIIFMLMDCALLKLLLTN